MDFLLKMILTKSPTCLMQRRSGKWRLIHIWLKIGIFTFLWWTKIGCFMYARLPLKKTNKTIILSSCLTRLDSKFLTLFQSMTLELKSLRTRIWVSSIWSKGLVKLTDALCTSTFSISNTWSPLISNLWHLVKTWQQKSQKEPKTTF
jgi:hypothetical protein